MDHRERRLIGTWYYMKNLNKNWATDVEIIIHRINSIRDLKKIDPKFGAEIDIRSWGSNLVLNHEPFQMEKTS